MSVVNRIPPTMSAVSRPAAERRGLLKAVYEEARECEQCQLHRTRTQVVFGSGNADAELMFIGEAPGAQEDRTGLPFVGQAGKLLDKLLNEIGMQRADVFICNTLRCRPPDNRDPQPNEIEACQDYLFRTVDLVEPNVVCTLGNFSTKMLRHDTTGISRLHGREEIRAIGPRNVRLYPLYHPAAALYTPSMLETLRTDFHRIPELIALGAPEQLAVLDELPELELDELQEREEAAEDGGGELPEPEEAAGNGGGELAREPEPASQLGLF